LHSSSQFSAVSSAKLTNTSIPSYTRKHQKKLSAVIEIAMCQSAYIKAEIF
jgi:hypothetical protein